MLALTLPELLRYSNIERERWRAWFDAHPGSVDVPVHPSGRFPSVGRLIDHIFLTEQRHLQGLNEAPLTDSTGLTGNNAPPLFDYGASVRRELEQYVAELDDDLADLPRTVTVGGKDVQVSPRKLLFHTLLHEVRHWAQIALAVRLAGLEPPGDHDLIHSRALR